MPGEPFKETTGGCALQGLLRQRFSRGGASPQLAASQFAQRVHDERARRDRRRPKQQQAGSRPAAAAPPQRPGHGGSPLPACSAFCLSPLAPTPRAAGPPALASGSSSWSPQGGHAHACIAPLRPRPPRPPPRSPLQSCLRPPAAGRRGLSRERGTSWGKGGVRGLTEGRGWAPSQGAPHEPTRPGEQRARAAATRRTARLAPASRSPPACFQRNPPCQPWGRAWACLRRLLGRLLLQPLAVHHVPDLLLALDLPGWRPKQGAGGEEHDGSSSSCSGVRQRLQSHAACRASFLCPGCIAQPQAQRLFLL